MSAATPDSPATLSEFDDDDIAIDASHLPPDLDLPIPQPGSVYPDFDALRYAINAWALRDKFLSRIHKKDSTRAIYICRQQAAGCSWRVRANLSREDERQVVVSVVHPTHTCTPGQHLDRDSKRKYAKRGVQFTQRWVRDALSRTGYRVTVETAPEDIVRVIAERFGETVSERLAGKAKTSILVSRGDVAPRRPGRPGRPSRAAIEERERDLAAEMQLRRAEDRQVREREMEVADEGCNNAGKNEDRPFVFESGARVIGPLRETRQPRRRVQVEVQPNLDPRLNGLSTMPGNEADMEGSVSESGQMSETVVPQPCHACLGTGIAHPNSATEQGQAVESQSRRENAKELENLRKQLLSALQQIDRMQKRRSLQGE